MAKLPISELPASQVDAELASLVAAAGPNERRVLLFLCRRFIGVGQRDFGQLDLRSELRDGFQETAEEAADGLFYMSLRFLLAQINRPVVPDAADTEPGQLEPPTPLLRPCEVCSDPGPVLYDGGTDAKNFARYCCQKCHSNPDNPFFKRAAERQPVHRSSQPVGSARQRTKESWRNWNDEETRRELEPWRKECRNEAGQPVEDDDVPEEDWP